MNALTVSSDAQALLLLASPLAGSGNDDATKRFSLREWNELARAIASSELRRPGALLGLEAQEIRRRTGVAEAIADRVARLLSRGVELAVELERLHTRGIWVITRADEGYPTAWKERLKERAPAVVFGVGNAALVNPTEAVAIVGSRDVDERGLDWTAQLALRCAREGVAVVSGGARGVDRAAMVTALAANGDSVGVVAESLTQMIRNRELREFLAGSHLALLSTNHPDARFTPGAAMERNKYIYALARWAVVVSSAAGEGGTWTGALENLKAGWTPVFVRNGDGVPQGNRQLLEHGARPIRIEELAKVPVREWFKAISARDDRQPGLFEAR